jgi:hypothetical protein
MVYFIINIYTFVPAIFIKPRYECPCNLYFDSMYFKIRYLSVHNLPVFIAVTSRFVSVVYTNDASQDKHNITS